MDPLPLLKKPKLEESVDDSGDTAVRERGGGGGGEGEGGEYIGNTPEEQEEVLVALIAHRTNEVEQNKQRAAYYKSQLEISERRLRDTQSQLARLRSRKPSTSSSSKTDACNEGSAKDRSIPSSSPVHINGTTSRAQQHTPPSRPQLLIPAPNPKLPTKSTAVTGAKATFSSSAPSSSTGKPPKQESLGRAVSEFKSPAESQAKRAKRMLGNLLISSLP